MRAALNGATAHHAGRRRATNERPSSGTDHSRRLRRPAHRSAHASRSWRRPWTWAAGSHDLIRLQLHPPCQTCLRAHSRLRRGAGRCRWRPAGTRRPQGPQKRLSPLMPQLEVVWLQPVPQQRPACLAQDHHLRPSWPPLRRQARSRLRPAATRLCRWRRDRAPRPCLCQWRQRSRRRLSTTCRRCRLARRRPRAKGGIPATTATGGSTVSATMTRMSRHTRPARGPGARSARPTGR